MNNHMQDLLHEFPLAKEEMGLERPLSETPNLLSSRQEEEDDGLSMMHASVDDAQPDMAHAKLFKEKTMSSDSGRASPQRRAHRSPSPRFKGQPYHSPMHDFAKWGKQVRKRRRRLFSPASLLVLPQRVSIPLPQREEKSSSSK